jgi:phospholipid/cholesterol/gamma-HCH transport system permease protein
VSEPEAAKAIEKRPSAVRMFLERTLIAIGMPAIQLFRSIGGVALFSGTVAFWLPHRPVRWGEIARHMRDIGFGSLFIVALSGLFNGLANGAQLLQLLTRYSLEVLVGPSTLLALSRELAPVLTGIMVAGNSGSRMATELGTMRVTEQIDAMSTMAVEPTQYLVVPRVIAAVIMVPMLTAIFSACGFAGVYAWNVWIEGMDKGVFLHETWLAADPDDFYEGWIKAAVFGLMIALISSYQGFFASGGARGVGDAATKAVVFSSVTVLIFDYALVKILEPLIHSYIRFNALPH